MVNKLAEYSQAFSLVSVELKTSVSEVIWASSIKVEGIRLSIVVIS
jgi:hypothetical protein